MNKLIDDNDLLADMPDFEGGNSTFQSESSKPDMTTADPLQSEIEDFIATMAQSPTLDMSESPLGLKGATYLA